MSLMSQYTPLESLDAVKYPELNRKVPEYAYEKLVDYAISLGVMQALYRKGIRQRRALFHRLHWKEYRKGD